MIYFRIFYKCLLFVLFLILFFSTGAVISLIHHDPVRRRKAFIQNCHRYNKMAAFLMGIQIVVRGNPDWSRSHLVAGNHMSFLDPMLMSAIQPMVFVTSQEMRETPVLGWIAELGGCVFVERRDRSNIQNEMIEIETALNQHFSVAIYPEATSTDGVQIYPFKKTLLMSCSRSHANILPVCLNYRKVNGEPFSDKWRDSICWYGKTPFYIILFRLFSLESVVAEFHFLEPIEVSESSDRSEVALRTQSEIEKHYVPVPRNFDKKPEQLDLSQA